MPKPRTKEEIRCRYFRWLLGVRDGVYFVDGRANTPSLGRRSLGTRNRGEALRDLDDLDLDLAVQHGLADRRLLQTEAAQLVALADGRQLYEKHVRRPLISGGPRPSTAKRYRAVFDKFLPFAEQQGLNYWNEVNRQTFDAYAAWLDGESYAYATEYLELNTLKQIIKFLIEYDHLPASVAFKYPMKKADGTDTYCWRKEEVQAIIEHCQTEELRWLQDAVIGLAGTGLRISELASLRWSDVDLGKGMITLTDETAHKSRGAREKRTTKSGYSRSFPIQDELRTVLENLDHHQDGKVFHGPLGGKIKADTVRRILIRDVLTPLASRFPPQGDGPGFIDGRLHSFRHYFCSNCANRGVKERVLMSWLGHRNSKMVPPARRRVPPPDAKRETLLKAVAPGAGVAPEQF